MKINKLSEKELTSGVRLEFESALRTLLAEIRTAAIFIGVTYTFLYKMSKKFRSQKKVIIMMLILVAILNTLSVVFLFTNDNYNDITILRDFVTMAYGITLTLFIIIFLTVMV